MICKSKLFSTVLTVTLVSVITFTAKSVLADDANNQPAPATTAPAAGDSQTPVQEPYKALTWSELLQQKYQVTAEQLKALDDAKMTDSQKAMLLQLSKLSGKSVEEVLAAREGGKKGWGSLAKQFGVEEKELGKAVSEMMKARNDERKKARESVKQINKQKAEANLKERAEKRAAAKKERQEKAAAAQKEREEKRAAAKKEHDEKLALEKAEREKKREEQEKLREAMKKEREERKEERKEKNEERKKERQENKGADRKSDK